MQDVLLLLLCAALGSTMISATIGVTSLCAGAVAPWSQFGTLWSVWWVGDALGNLVMAPILLVWSAATSITASSTTEAGSATHRRPLETIALLAAALFASLVVFAEQPGLGLDRYPLQYVIFPFVIWAALRIGQVGTTGVVFLASAVAIWSTANGFGPFTRESVHESLIVLQLFMGIVSSTGLFLGAAIGERDASNARRAADFAALERSGGRLRVALDAGRMGVWDWNVRTGGVDWSENLEPMHGLAKGEFPGRFGNFEALVHPEDRPRVSAELQRVLESGAGYDIEFRIVWPDDSVHWVAAKGRVMRDTEGQPVRMLGITADINERRHLEEELRDRARELADSDRRKDEFLAMLAHELRNPLAPLSTSLQLLAIDPAKHERFVAIAERQVKHLARLVDDLLDVSRISRGKVTLRKEPVVLSEAIDSAAELTRSVIEDRGLRFTVSLPPEPILLEADAVRIAQVFSNLLNNAAKYTPKGGSVWVTGERQGDEAIVVVRDTGVGLVPDLLPHVFDLFVQGTASLDRTTGGLGIGLTLVRSLVELHGGRVEARSAGIGKGSEFVVRLPALAAARASPRPAVPPGTRPGAPGPLRILVVEDNQDTAEMLGAMFKMSGHEVELAADGFTALRTAESFRPAVVVSDLGLPGMDGYELARRIRQQERSGDLVLVALSGYGREEDRLKTREAGFDHHLVKPADVDKILGIVAELAAREADRQGTAVRRTAAVVDR